MNRDSTSSPLPPWAAVCFLVSGAAGLLYEVVWSKQFAFLLGNSLHASATVVAAFLGGLALGARFLGVPLARRGNGARHYALLELGVAALGLVSLPVLRGLDPVVGTIYRGLGGETAAFGFARFVLLSILLLPPAALMGATLPVLVAHLETRLVGPALSRLYAVNTLGAVVGSVAGGFALLPGIGLLATTWVAAALNLVAAGIAWSAAGSRREVAAPVDADPPSAPAPVSASAKSRRAPRDAAKEAEREAPATAGERRALALLFGLSGFAALAFQIAWMRLFGLVLGSSVYSFAAVLGVYLLGLALGSAASAPLLRRGVSWLALARLQLALALVAAIALHVFPRLPEWMYALVQRAGTRWLPLFGGEVALVALIVFVPCLLLGAIFPITTRLLQARDTGHAAAFAYAVNTLGTIAGSLAAGFLLVPALGVAGTHLAALFTSLAIGLIVLVFAWRRRPSAADAGLALVAVAAVAGLALTAPRWDPSLMSAGLFRPEEARHVAERAGERGGAGATVWRGTRMERVLFYREGLNGSVLVGMNEETGNRWLRVGGKVDAGTTDMETQALLGLIPAALADSGAHALVIGLGSGATASALLAAGAGPTDILELEPAVVEASRFFHEPEDDPLRDPRARLVVGDARTWLAHGATRYDVVVSQPSNPWMAGVNNLFTVDFYRLVRSRLAERGVFCQWLQLYELTPESIASLLSSFLAVFPEGHAFAVWGARDLLLVAAPPSARLDLARLRAPAVLSLLESARIGEPEGIAGHYAGTLSALRPLAQGAPLNRDDRPIVEYRAPRDLVATGADARAGADLQPFTAAMPAGALYADWSPEQWYAARAGYLLGIGDTARTMVALRGAEAAGLGAVAQRMRADVDRSLRRHRVLTAVGAAKEADAAGRGDEAVRILEAAVREESSDALVWVFLANQYRLAARLSAAESTLALAPAAGDPHVLTELAITRGLVALARARPAAAAAHFREAQRWSPGRAQTYALEARALREAGSPDSAAAAVARGLRAAPHDPELLRLAGR